MVKAHPDLQYVFAHMRVIGILALALALATALLVALGRSVILDSGRLSSPHYGWRFSLYHASKAFL